MLVAFEGIDGSGKSTLARATAAALRLDGRAVHLTQEPTKTALGKRVRQAIRSRADAATLCGLFLADRAAHAQRIRRRLDGGQLVLTDRYADSTTAYQSHALRAIHAGALQELRTLQADLFPQPDLVVWCDLAPRAALARMSRRRIREPFERLRFLEAVRANYAELAQGQGRRWLRLDAAKPVQELVDATLRRIVK